jgi:hypothetical protein
MRVINIEDTALVFPIGRATNGGLSSCDLHETDTYPGDALAHVFRSHQAELVRLAAFILGDRGAAEDVVQDVFVRVHQRAGAMTGETSPATAPDGRWQARHIGATARWGDRSSAHLFLRRG